MDLLSIMDFSSKAHSLLCQLPKIEVSLFHPCSSSLVLHIVDINGLRYVRTEDIGLGESYIGKFATQGYAPFLWLRFGRNGSGIFTSVDNAISGVCIDKCSKSADMECMSILDLQALKNLKGIRSAYLTQEQIRVCHSMYEARLRMAGK